MTTKSTPRRKVLIVVGAILLALCAATVWYFNDYYHADKDALAVVADENGDQDGVVVLELSDSSIAFVPEQPTAGLVFYPGAKVQPEAYAPLLERCAEQGLLCVVVKPLLNFALFSPNLADGALREFPEISTWIVAGHSLGGVVASDYGIRHADQIDGIAFIASYPNADLSGFEGSSISLVGTNDGVLNWDKFEQTDNQLPSRAKKQLIEGGNHAYFGNYGEQAGDGVAAISREEQQRQTADELVAFAHAA